jgi:hypothetical protein
MIYSFKGCVIIQGPLCTANQACDSTVLHGGTELSALWGISGDTEIRWERVGCRDTNVRECTSSVREYCVRGRLADSMCREFWQGYLSQSSSQF